MAVDIKKLFNDDLPSAMSRNADEVKGIGAKFQVNIEGEGQWFLDASASGPSCVAGTQDADCTVGLASEDFQKLYENPSSGMQLFFQGKLKVAGNQMLAMKLQKLFALK